MISIYEFSSLETTYQPKEEYEVDKNQTCIYLYLKH